MDESKVLFPEIESQRNLLTNVLPVIIHQNRFFAPSKNVLLTMLGNENKAIWAKAVNMIS